MAATPVPRQAAASAALPERSFAAIVCGWPGVDAAGGAAVRECVERLSAAGVDLMAVSETGLGAMGAIAAVRPGGPGRVLLAPDNASTVHELLRSGCRLVWPGARRGDGTGGEMPEPTDALDWLVRDLWDRGVGPGLILVINDPPCPGRSVPHGATHVDGRAVLGVLTDQFARRAARRVPHVDESAGWCVVVQGDLAHRRRVDESLLTVADGRVGTRGSLEEDGPGTDPLVVVGGVYDGRDPLVTLLAAPAWTGLEMQGPRTGVERRVLDLRTGVLARACETPGGPLRTVRFASAARPGAAGLRAEAPLGAMHPGPSLQPPTTEAGYESGTTEHVAWARTTSTLGGGIVSAAVQTTGADEELGVVERLVTVRADPHVAPAAETAIGAVRELSARGFDQLLAEQRATWARRWADADIVIDGDAAVQLGARFALFHLLASVTGDGEAALGARGLSGRAYAGHVFWDADVYALPALAAMHPPAARAMLEYRLRRLSAARAAAAEQALDGALFPWESAHDGREVTPAAVRHSSGAVVPVLTREYAEHIVADVAWGAWQYTAWTGDRDFLAGPGRPLLVDTARYWASRIRVDSGGVGHIDGVMGPDEYHGPVDDNAFTNVMARWNLRRAADLVERLAPHAAGREAVRWRAAAEALADGFVPATEVYEQFAGFFDLEPLLIEELASVPVAADLLLGAERTAAAQVIKQPDVLMLHHLVPEETAAGSLAPNLEFYGPRTAHGSSLSPAIHAALLARAGQADAALEWLRLACRLDLDDLTGTTAGGLHIATFGGVWQALVFGFAGLRPRGQLLECDPALPAAWDRLAIHVRFRGARVAVEIDREGVTACADGRGPVAISYAGKVHEVDQRHRRLQARGARS